MALENTTIEDDLEDGEIESDSEVTTIPTEIESPSEKLEPETTCPVSTVEKLDKQKDNQKKRKDHHKTERNKTHREKFNRQQNCQPPIEDDIAHNMEKALRKVLKKGENSPNDKNDSGVEDFDVRKKVKKRKRHENIEKESRKRKKHDKDREDVDEDEMMCVRGASPVQREQWNSSPLNSYSDDHESYTSDNSSQDDREPRSHFPKRRSLREFAERKGKNPRRRDGHPLQDPEGVCLYFMQGKCHRGDDCVYSHDAYPPRKMELCKFYLMDCCAKREKCLYMHSDFPCKFYHTGLPCLYKDDDCKFAHGKPLSEPLKTILLKHIETAPKEILGDFPRISRESANSMVANAQVKLQQQYSPGNGEVKEKNIPSLFELNIPKPAALDELSVSEKPFQTNNEKHIKGSKTRQSRWCDTSNNARSVNNPAGVITSATENILNIQNLSNVLTPPLITKLKAFGVENLNQLSQLTVMQLNQIGLTMSQINEIQLNTLNIQKLGLINSDKDHSSTVMASSQDSDMRIAPLPSTGVSTTSTTTNPLSNDTSSKDVDMRFCAVSKPNICNPDAMINNKSNKDSIDIDQYTQDALKFGMNDVENSDVYNNDNINALVGEPEQNITVRDVDHRVLQYVEDASKITVQPSMTEAFVSKTNVDTDIRIHPQHLVSSINEKAIRQSTTDEDDDNNLQIDEKWYSSDEEHAQKKFSKNKVFDEIPRDSTPPNLTPTTEPSNLITQLGDLSKIDISAEVSRLLSSLKNNSPGITDLSSGKEQLKPRDPRGLPKTSTEHKPSMSESVKSSTIRTSKMSIYECTDGEDTDERKRIDIDLRPSILDHDFRLSTFGDTDLRQTPGTSDIDLRLTLPFKPIPNYTPATEINGSIGSHPPIAYKLYCVDIPRPNYAVIKKNTPKFQAGSDPRLRKVFRLSVEESPAEPDILKPLNVPRADPRTRRKDSSDTPETTKPNTLDLQVVIQHSNWYKELSSNHKILVNQQLATVSSSLKKFHQDKTPGKTYDLIPIHSNNILHSIFSNLRISLDDKGNFSYTKNQDSNFTSSVEPFMNNSMGLSMEGMNMLGMATGVMVPGHIGPGNLGNVNMGPIGMNNIGPMGNMQSMGFDPRFTPNNNRTQPGLLGVAPNVPHNFDGGGFNGMPSFSIDSNYNNFNGQVGGSNINDFSNNADDFKGGESETYFRKKSNEFGRGGGFRGSRGRGSERRGRGGNRGGGRDRRNYSDRGSWKSDR